MQYPAGSEFNFVTMRMEMANFWEVVTSPWAQAKFMHTINAGYMTGAMFVLSISAWYLIKGRDIDFAKKSILKKYTADVSKATPDQIRTAALSTVPAVNPMYWSFRLMVGCAIASLLIFLLCAWFSIKNNMVEKKKLLWLSLLAMPLPWIACEAGWFVVLYAVLLVVELWLMVRFAKLGPSSLSTGRYFFERKA